MKKSTNIELFESAPISKAVLSLALPTIISQIVTIIYNMADTFFIGRMNDPRQVAAATLATPVFMILTGIANLFGIGGNSLTARMLGINDREKAKKCTCFSIWGGIAVAFLYGVLVFALKDVLLPFIGAKADTSAFCQSYLFWTVTIGAVPTVLNPLLAHMVRSEGNSGQASIGVMLGVVLNIILDPIFIFTLKLEIAGAAIATMISNTVASVYFIILILGKKGESVITFDMKYFSLKGKIPREIILVGLPSSLMNLLAMSSNLSLNRIMANESTKAIAGAGIAKKIDMLAFAIATGMTQGCLALFAYNFSAKNYKRMRDSVKTALLYCMGMSLACTVLLLTCAAPVSRLFIDDPGTVAYAEKFVMIMALSCPTAAATMTCITFFQATGCKVRPTILSLLRRGCVDIPLMILFSKFANIWWVSAARPIADAVGLTVGLCLLIPFWNHFVKLEKEEEAAKLSGSGE